MICSLHRRPSVNMGRHPLKIFFSLIHISIKNGLNLEFSCDFNKQDINFLDINLRGYSTSGIVSTCTYRKEHAGNSVLVATSCHQLIQSDRSHLGNALDLKINCSTDKSFAQECDIATSRLIAHKYNSKGVGRAIVTAADRDRSTLLKYKSCKKCKFNAGDTLTFVATYLGKFN